MSSGYRPLDPHKHVLVAHDDGRWYTGFQRAWVRQDDGSWRAIVEYTVAVGSKHLRSVTPDMVDPIEDNPLPR